MWQVPPSIVIIIVKLVYNELIMQIVCMQAPHDFAGRVPRSGSFGSASHVPAPLRQPVEGEVAGRAQSIRYISMLYNHWLMIRVGAGWLTRFNQLQLIVPVVENWVIVYNFIAADFWFARIRDLRRRTKTWLLGDGIAQRSAGRQCQQCGHLSREWRRPLRSQFNPVSRLQERGARLVDWLSWHASRTKVPHSAYSTHVSL